MSINSPPQLSKIRAGDRLVEDATGDEQTVYIDRTGHMTWRDKVILADAAGAVIGYHRPALKDL